jgi:hypothetical protein
MRISRQQWLDLHRATDTLEKVQAEYAIVREILVRLVEQKRTISFDFTDEIPDGMIKWDTVQTESGSREMTVWYEPLKSDAVEETKESVNAQG